MLDFDTASTADFTALAHRIRRLAALGLTARIMAECLLATADDADRLASGWTPDAETLATAPTMTDCIVDPGDGPGDEHLVGVAIGHPALSHSADRDPGLPARHHVSSVIIVISFAGGWARCRSRWWRFQMAREATQ